MRTSSALGVLAAAAMLAPMASAQTAWPNVNLPTSFTPVGAGFTEDFEAAAGVAPSYMALTAIDAVTGLPDPEAWANIGQNAVTSSPFGGSYCLEMGLNPVYTAFHDVQNAMVLGLNGGGAAQLYLDMYAHNGGEETDAFDGVWVSDDGIDWYNVAGNPWSTLVPSGNAWTAVFGVDLSTSVADLSGDFYLMIAQDDNFPFVPAGTSASDGIGIDDVAVTLTQTPVPPPPPASWTFVNLPTTFVNVAGGFFEDFEAAAGVIPGYMAITELDTATLLPNPNVWANIGQHGANSAPNSFSGVYHLEMAWAPLLAGGDTKNAMVLGLNGAGASNLDQLSFQIWDKFDELDAFDGVWVSDNGTDWSRLHDGNSASAWTLVSGLDMTFGGVNPVNLSGDFYLMFSQDDNTYWNGNDGIAFDDIRLGAIPPPPPVIALTGTCGVLGSSIDVSGATPNGMVALAYGFGSGSAAVAGGPACVGMITALDSINLLPNGGSLQFADANGDASFSGGGGMIPANACGQVTVQLADVATCVMSNTIAL